MPLPLVPILMGLAQVAPSIVGLLSGSKAEEKAQKVADLAMAVTGAASPEAAVDAIRNDPQVQGEFLVRFREIELEIYREDTKRLEIVNKTMQEEGRSEHWPQFSWRPFNGFSFPLAVIGIYFVLPCLGKTVPSVPEMVWIGWLTILGVATWDRGKEKRAVAGETKTGLLEGAINAIRGKA